MVLQAIDAPTLLVIAGIILLMMEAMAPGANFIVLGVALLVAGLLGLAVGSVLGGTVSTLVLAGMVLITGAATLFVYREFDLYGGTEAGQTSNSDSLTGQTGYVTERVTKTDGQIKLEDGGFNPYFQARSMDQEIEEGAEVIVVDPGGGNVLTVDSFEHLDEDEIDRALARDRDVDSDATEGETAQSDETGQPATGEPSENAETEQATE
ncbi:NfeD family protein [Natronoarchaeum sp. GCM10025703]|uniref:NfeD family protein n=1 Tax=unclassified Natronoarchaeum TaxID=2620183 RepID=UPI003617550B